MNNKLNLSVARGHEDQNPPGARVWTEDTPHGDSGVVYQEVTAELLLNLINEVNEEENAVIETATASESPTVAESYTIPRDEQVISTVKETPSELTPQEEEFISIQRTTKPSWIVSSLISRLRISSTE